MKKAITPLIALLAIAGAVFWIFRSQTGNQKFDLNPYQALGAGTAEETARVVGTRGSVVVVSQDTAESSNAAIDGQLKAFQDTIKKGKTLSIAEVVKFKVTPLERMSTGGAMPREQFMQVLKKHPDLGAVVMFCGFPPLAAQDYTVLKQSGVKVVVASGYMSIYRKLLEAKLIELAIIPRFETAAASKPPRTLRDWFDQDFQVITAANVGSLP